MAFTNVRTKENLAGFFLYSVCNKLFTFDFTFIRKNLTIKDCEDEVEELEKKYNNYIDSDVGFTDPLIQWPCTYYIGNIDFFFTLPTLKLSIIPKII